MAYRYEHFERSRPTPISTEVWTAWSNQPVLVTLAALLIGYCFFQRLDVLPLLPLTELLWNILVYATPSSLVLALDRRQEKDGVSSLDNSKYGDSRTFAAKSEAMRRILRFAGGSWGALSRPRAFSGVTSLMKGSTPFSLPGLGNWDNSCYQNSVIQGLASLPTVARFLKDLGNLSNGAGDDSTGKALLDIIGQLNDPENGGTRLWTPPTLKSMSSWQQQDASEYYGKIFDDIAEETKKELVKSIKENTPLSNSHAQETTAALETSKASSTQEGKFPLTKPYENPVEGLLAQRVGCLHCGHVDGLSLVPFNSLILPLHMEHGNSVEDCLDHFTQLETIDEVECGRCTLLKREHDLQEFLTNKERQTSEPLLTQVQERLQNVQQALHDGDYAEITIAKKCQIPGKSRVSSTKTKQVVIAREPQSLVLHINRSVFNEQTGALSKNISPVSFPEVLDLAWWSLGAGDGNMEQWITTPNSSLLDGPNAEVSATFECKHDYVLRAVITHFGRHENGHYVCFRRDPSDDEQWWRLSDDDVSPANLNEVLGQGSVFMLFYTRKGEVACISPNPNFSTEKTENLGIIEDESGTLSAAPLNPQDDNIDTIPIKPATAGLPVALINDVSSVTSTPNEPLHKSTDYRHTIASSAGLDVEEANIDELADKLAEIHSLAPPMRTAGTNSDHPGADNRPRIASLTNMVAAN